MDIQQDISDQNRAAGRKLPKLESGEVWKHVKAEKLLTDTKHEGVPCACRALPIPVDTRSVKPA